MDRNSIIYDRDKISIADKLPSRTKVKITERDDITYVEFIDRIYAGKGFSHRSFSVMPISRDERARRRLQENSEREYTRKNNPWIINLFRKNHEFTDIFFI